MKYGVIVADPAWEYFNAATNGAALKHYPTMATEAICATGNAQMASVDSLLLLWATYPKLPEALKVVEAWGFVYTTAFPWIKLQDEPRPTLFGEWSLKPTFGCGFWVRGCSELVIIAKRGKISPPEQSFVGLLSKRFAHSRKPESLYEYAEALPGPYLELFARRRRANWDSWGNEIDGRDLRDLEE